MLYADGYIFDMANYLSFLFEFVNFQLSSIVLEMLKNEGWWHYVD